MSGESPVSSCVIFDANAWIFLFTGANQRASNLVETAIMDNHQIVVNQYLLSEVFAGLDRSGLLSGPKRTPRKMTFLDSGGKRQGSRPSGSRLATQNRSLSLPMNM